MNIRMGLIGAGHMGKVFAQMRASNVADAGSKTGEEVAARFGIECHNPHCHELLKCEDSYGDLN